MESGRLSTDNMLYDKCIPQIRRLWSRKRNWKRQGREKPQQGNCANVLPSPWCRWTWRGCWRAAPEGWWAAPSRPCRGGQSGGRASGTWRWTPPSSPGTHHSAAAALSPLPARDGGEEGRRVRSTETTTHTERNSVFVTLLHFVLKWTKMVPERLGISWATAPPG